MRHLIRNATLAALCALVLGLATVANATRPDRPIDSPEGQPTLDPTMVGDPDTGHNLVIERLRQLLLIAEMANPQLKPFLDPVMSTAKPKQAAARRGSLSRVRR